jgi:cytoskeletal protein RodZ
MQDETSNFTKEINYKKNNNKTVMIKTKNKCKPKINFNLIIIIILIVICLVQFLIIYFLKKEKQNNDDFDTNDEDDTDDKSCTSDNNNLGSLYLYKGDNSLFINNNKTDIFKDKTKIHIAMCLDNKGVYPTLVSMTSALENQDKKILF